MLGRRGLDIVRSTWCSSWASPSCQLKREVSTKILSRRATIRDARQLDSGSRVAVGGWVKSVRKHKSVSFVNVNDGSCLGELQITLPSEETGEAAAQTLGAKLSDITVGSSVFVEGELREVPGGKHKRLELHPSALEVLGKCDTQRYPLQKKYHSLEFLRENLHLRARTNTFGAVTRVRNALGQGLHSYFQENDFLHLHSPILTSNDCEGAGELFRIAKIGGKDDEFFGTPTYLTVSGQLHAEMYACALSKVYTFGPTFRAENSNTTRHLAEFWMVEPEMAFAGLDECIASAQGAIQRSVAHALDSCAEDIAFFNKNYDKQITERLERVVKKDFARLTYTEAIEVLQKAMSDGKGKVSFEKKPEWGIDLQTEHERFLAETYVGGPVFVTDYPADIKAFYMRKNAPDSQDRETVAGMDLLVPKIGELVGGSVREERFEVLEKKMRQLRLIPEEDLDEEAIASAGGDLDWYLDLRRFGSVPHAGWGLGFERLVLFATGMDNIRDVIPLPRFPGQCKH
ncbi:Asparagine-tRNA ligase [Phytophthora palmivora]|uniref:asparagine--tRNA ligase n=1 Tax=Phytophthora palmivora TaxID=4796 RepID=A0A2P4X567_9STRA|nr:Asparagine-tRNA ligase [Phytophthora palmivora]